MEGEKGRGDRHRESEREASLSSSSSESIRTVHGQYVAVSHHGHVYLANSHHEYDTHAFPSLLPSCFSYPLFLSSSSCSSFPSRVPSSLLSVCLFPLCLLFLLGSFVSLSSLRSSCSFSSSFAPSKFHMEYHPEHHGKFAFRSHHGRYLGTRFSLSRSPVSSLSLSPLVLVSLFRV